MVLTELVNLIHCFSINVPTLASCSFDEQGLILILFFVNGGVEMKKRDQYYQRQRYRNRSAEFSNVPIVHKFVWLVTHNLDFKVTIFFNV